MSLNYDLLFTPFSSQTFHRSLLLQFTLTELFAIHNSLQSNTLHFSLMRHPPYDYQINRGPFVKAQEYISLLADAFPREKKATTAALRHLNKLIKKPSVAELITLYIWIEKLITEEEGDENLLFFMLKHRAQIDHLMGKDHLKNYLLSISPSGLRSLEEMVCDRYHERGFFSLIPELKDLIHSLDTK